jgi:hypothetical protein
MFFFVVYRDRTLILYRLLHSGTLFTAFILGYLHQPISMVKNPTSNDPPKAEALTNPASDLQPVTAGGDHDTFSYPSQTLYMSLQH